MSEPHTPSDPISPREITAGEPEPEVLYCPQCGATMAPAQRYCSECGWDAENPEVAPPGLSAPPASPRNLGPASDKNRLTALLLCILLGFLGVHRFYIGRPGTGFLWLATLGVFAVGVIYDAVMLATGELLDGQGRRVLHWQ